MRSIRVGRMDIWIVQCMLGVRRWWKMTCGRTEMCVGGGVFAHEITTRTNSNGRRAGMLVDEGILISEHTTYLHWLMMIFRGIT